MFWRYHIARDVRNRCQFFASFVTEKGKETRRMKWCYQILEDETYSFDRNGTRSKIDKLQEVLRIS